MPAAIKRYNPSRQVRLNTIPKHGRVVLRGDAYIALTRQVFTRDRWQCRCCGRRVPLQAHHLVERSDVRLDTLENLIALCTVCHEAVTRNRLVVLDLDANQLVRFRTAEKPC